MKFVLMSEKAKWKFELQWAFSFSILKDEKAGLNMNLFTQSLGRGGG